MEDITFSRFVPGDRQPYTIVGWDVDGVHYYSAPSHASARHAACKLSENGRYSIIHRMQGGYPVAIEQVYRDGREVTDLSSINTFERE